MKKFLLGLLTIIGLGAFAQDLSLVNTSGEDITGTTINLSVDDIADAEVDFHVHNAGSEMSVRLQVIHMSTDTSGFSYCVGNSCVMPNTAISPVSVISTGEDVNVEFHLQANSFLGHADYKLRIFNEDDSSEEVFLLVNFIVEEPIVEESNFTLVDESGSDITGTTVSVAADSTKNAHFDFTFNNTGTENVTVKMQVIKESSDATGYIYCIGTVCVTPNVPLSPEQDVAAGENVNIEFELTDSDFQGPTNYKLRFFNVDNETEEVFVDIDFDIVSDIPTLLADRMISDLYPNPAREFVNIEIKDNINGDLHIDVYNMLGKKIDVYFTDGNMGKVSIPISNYENGTYFCIFSINGESIKTEKLIVH